MFSSFNCCQIPNISAMLINWFGAGSQWLGSGSYRSEFKASNQFHHLHLELSRRTGLLCIHSKCQWPSVYRHCQSPASQSCREVYLKNCCRQIVLLMSPGPSPPPSSPLNMPLCILRNYWPIYIHLITP